MEVDKNNFRQVILDSAKQLEKEMPFFNELCLTRRSFNKVILCGMGGSALAGDFFEYFKKKNFAPLALKVPVSIHRSYELPPDADEKSLILCVSYSGNTEETLSAFRAAQKENLEAAGMACGGALGEAFTENKIPWIKIPDDKLPPRSSLGYQLKGFIKILMAYGLLNSSASSEIANFAQNFSPQEMETECRGKSQSLANKIPIIYASDENAVLARLWKIKFNENSKIPAFYNIFPELNHNEMVGWTKSLGPFSIIILRDNDDLPRVKKRMDLSAKLLEKSGLPVQFIDISGANALEKLFRTSIYGDWLSYFLAVSAGIDPYPVPMVEEFKKEMAA